MDAADPAFNRTAGIEVTRRLAQLDWILARIRALEAEMVAALAIDSQEKQVLVDDLERQGLSLEDAPVVEDPDARARAVKTTRDVEEMRLLTETFYYFAWRIE